MRPTKSTVFPTDQLTGEPRVPSTLSKTKDNADHAGPSLPFLQLRDTTSSKPVLSFPSQSKKLLTATPKAKVATVVGNPGQCNGTREPLSLPRVTTHTKASKELANQQATPELLRLLSSTQLQLNPSMLSRLPLSRVQLLSPSVLVVLSSKPTRAVS